MHRQLATVGHFHLAVSRTGSARPRHDVEAAIDLATLVALLQKAPDGFVILRREGKVATAPLVIAQPGDQLMRFACDRLASGCLESGLLFGA